MTMLKVEGFDDCILGVVERIGQDAIICYDKVKVIRQLMEEGMDTEEALEFFEYNMLGAYMGEGTPCFITTKNDYEELAGEPYDF